MSSEPRQAVAAAWAVCTLVCCLVAGDAVAEGRPSDTRTLRVERAGAKLASERVPGPVSYRIVSRAGLGAWAWPSGRIEITRDLVDRLDDDELTAALAHELAHLATLAGVRKRASLASSSGADAAAGDALERAADRDGCATLASAGVPPQAMVSMLKKLAAGLRDGRSLAGRIAAASAACGVATVPR